MHPTTQRRICSGHFILYLKTERKVLEFYPPETQGKVTPQSVQVGADAWIPKPEVFF